MKTTIWLACVTAAVLTASCSASSSKAVAGAGGGTDAGPGSPASASIGTSGGTVTTSDGSATLTVPAGAVSATTAITITPSTLTVPGAVGQVWEIGPTGTQFATPVTLTLAYTDAELGGKPAADFAVSTVVGSGWQPIAAGVVNTAAHVITGQTTHLSPYALSSLVQSSDDGGLSTNGPNCPVTPPSAGDFCNFSGPCSWNEPNGYDYAYCDGTNWETFVNPTGCPTMDPGGSATNCGSFAQTCSFVASDFDCFDACTCVSEAWVCKNDCACVPPPVVDTTTTGDEPATGLDGQCSASATTCATTSTQGSCVTTVTYTCTGGKWTSATFTTGPTSGDCSK